MNDLAVNNLTKEKIQQLLAAVGSRPSENDEQIETAEYNWRQPRYFDTEESKKLNEFTKKTSSVIAEKLSSLFNAKYNVIISSTAQHFADQFFAQVEGGEKDSYYLAFGTDKELPCGVVVIPPQTSIGWVTQLLGDSETEQDTGRGLSELEESLLWDIAAIFVRALFEAHNSCNFQPSQTIIQGKIPLQFGAAEEICEITFEIRKDESESSDRVHVLIACSRMNRVAGKTDRADKDSAAKDVSQIITNHLQKISVPVTVQLGVTMLNFEQMITLQADNVIVLDKKVREDADLVVQGRKLMQGRLARVNGNKALVITDGVV